MRGEGGQMRTSKGRRGWERGWERGERGGKGIRSMVDMVRERSLRKGGGSRAMLKVVLGGRRTVA